MVRSTMRRAAALAGASALAVLAAAGPALAADVAPAPQTLAAAAGSGPATAPAQQGQQDPQEPQGTSQDQAPTPADGEAYIIWCHHHEGLVSELLETVGDLLGALL
jgi:hypothetical protein